jgi:hypothetical protein
MTKTNDLLPKKISLETDLRDEIDALKAQSADLLAALKALTEDSEEMVREYPCSPKLRLIDDARAAIKKAEMP